MVSKDTAVLNENDQLVCSCSDDEDTRSILSFYLDNSYINPYAIPFDDDFGRRFGRSNDNKTLYLEKESVSMWDGGEYICFNRYYHTRLYIWVKTKERFFLAEASEKTLRIPDRSSMKVPCVPTSPCYDVKLFKGSKELAINETNGVKFDPRKGFIITNPRYIDAPVDFTCSITLDGRTERMVSKDTAVLNENDRLVCSCSDNENNRSTLSFYINNSEINPYKVPFTDEFGMSYEKSNDNTTLYLKKKNVSMWDGGDYVCFNSYYLTRMYIWVKTKERFFLAKASEKTLKIFDRSSMKIPCVPTSPCYNVKLFKGSQELAINETNGIKFDPRKGFIITNPRYFDAPVDFTCSITLDGRTESMLYHTKFDF
ncbi:hypothetical protein HCN44_007550 [Aphidius gifuensis]|uniref:Ig-like domain-containing protein n=1 Tax=Aphidius gifuensis TaxID=684658 RepID=A0A834XL82_APHGI|nr:hypothetical protein HCN44_007550 [Aphidius gifuensis]